MADYTGSFSGSFEGTFLGGVISSSAQLSVDWNGTVITNKPTTISPFQANSIISNNRFRENAFPAHSASVSTRLTTITTDVTDLSERISAAVSGTVPPGTISESAQIADLGYLTSASAAALGFGSGGGTSTDISSLNTFTASIQSEVNTLTSATSSYLTSASAAALGFGGGETYTVGLGISISGSVISLDTSSTHFRLGVSGAASSYGFGSGGGSFGDPPVIDQSGLQIREYTGSGVFVGTLTVTDPTPGDTATWATQSGYSAGYFGITTGGDVTTLLNPTSSWNTAAGSGSNNAHPFLVQVTDGQNNTVTGTIYVYVLPNNAPQFRSGSISGNVITSYTSSYIAEASTISTVGINDIYVTDVEGDTIFIGSGSWITGNSSHFAVSRTGSYIRFLTNTSSLDYDTYPYYEMVLTASDAKYVDNGGSDLDSISYLYVRINVADNTAPFVTPAQSFSVNESGSDDRQVGLVSIVNPDDATGTIVSFQIYSSSKSPGNTNLSGSFNGTSLYDPTDDPFTTSGNYVVVKAGAKLNYDLVDTYVYNVGVRDSFDPQTNYETITINILDHATSSIGVNNGTYYILETALQGTDITSASNGYSSGSVTFTSSTSQMWNVNTVPSGYVRFTNGNTYQTASSVTLEVGSDISASLVYGQSVVVQITASQTSFETTKQYRTHTLSITENKAFSASFADTSSNLNTNGARPSNNLTTLSFTELQSGIGDTLNHNTFTFISSSANITASRSGDKYLVYAKSNLSAGLYTFTASIADNHGKVGSGSHSITIAQAGTGSLTTNEPFYVIESAVSGAFIYTSTNGRSGDQGDLGVTYSPTYNSAAVQAFTSSNSLIHVTNVGGLSLATNLSGSNPLTGSGDTITSTIYWQDQYGNIGTGSISVNVAINNAPTVNGGDSPTTDNHNTNLGVAGAQLATLTWSDTEGDALNVGSFSLTGVSASLLSSSYNGSNIFKITALNDLNAGTINYTASIKDVHGFRSGSYADSFTIAQAGDGSLSTTNFYIIESAISGASIVSTNSGTGSAASLSVTYTPVNYGGQSAQQFRTLDSIVEVSSSGRLTIKDDISGSAYQGGSSFSVTAYWLDQYGNEGTGSFTLNIVDNKVPSASFTDQSLTAPLNSVGTNLVSVTLTDPEGLTPFSMSLSGPSAVSMSAVPQNVGSSSYQLQNSVAIGTGCILFYTASVFDSYNQETQYKRSLTITSASAASPLWYLYTSEPGQYAEIDEATYLITYGDANDDGVTDAGYPFDNLTGGDIGQSSFTSSAYTGFGTDNNTLVASGSILGGSNVTPLISNLNHLNLGFMIVFPSSSEVGITPSSTTNALGGSTPNQYVLFADRPGTGALNDNPQTSYVRYFDLDSGTYPNSSATRFGVIFVGGGASNITYFLMASSGSTPTSTQ
jgi:VCBS repeat-containing protein